MSLSPWGLSLAFAIALISSGAFATGSGCQSVDLRWQWPPNSIRDQGGVGSCQSFAMAALMEADFAQHFLKSVGRVSLAPMDLLHSTFDTSILEMNEEAGIYGKKYLPKSATGDPTATGEGESEEGAWVNALRFGVASEASHPYPKTGFFYNDLEKELKKLRGLRAAAQKSVATSSATGDCRATATGGPVDTAAKTAAGSVTPVLTAVNPAQSDKLQANVAMTQEQKDYIVQRDKVSKLLSESEAAGAQASRDWSKRYFRERQLKIHYKGSAETPQEVNSKIAAILAKGKPVQIGIKNYQTMRDGSGDYSQHASGHAVVIAGYDCNTNEYLIRNSWGPAKKDDGYERIPAGKAAENVMSLSYLDDLNEPSTLQDGQSNIPEYLGGKGTRTRAYEGAGNAVARF